MAEIGLICNASVPPGMMVSVTIQEDVDNDGDYEHEVTQRLQDGTFVYVLEGFETSEESSWGSKVEMGRDDENYDYTIDDEPNPPRISSIKIILPGGPESGDLDPNAIIWKFREVDYFYNLMEEGPHDHLPFHLGGYLNAIYSIHEVLPIDWHDWAETEPEIELHKLMLKLRHQHVHLRKPSRGSIKPPLTQSIKWDFGDPSKVVRGEYIFDVSPSIIEEYVQLEDLIEPADQNKTVNDSRFARIVPVVPLCEIYTTLLFNFLSDWFDNMDSSEYKFHVNSLLS